MATPPAYDPEDYLITPATVRTKFPECFAAGKPGENLTDTDLEALIVEAYGLTDITYFATLYCIAHFITLEEEALGWQDGGSDVISSENLGGRSVSYQVQTTENRDGFFASSPYGRKVLQYERRAPRSALSAMNF